MSERTVYRDLRDLSASGTPIEGEPGVGYRLRGYDLPPLMFDKEEIEALVLGARIVESFGDERLARASRGVLSKVAAVLPKHLQPVLSRTALFAPNIGVGRRSAGALASVRHAVDEQRKIAIDYRREDGEASRRILRPLGAFFWGKVWTLAAWCELRDDFRNFRLDRMQNVTVLDDRFEEEPGKTLRDYLRAIDERAIDLLNV